MSKMPFPGFRRGAAPGASEAREDLGVAAGREWERAESRGRNRLKRLNCMRFHTYTHTHTHTYVHFAMQSIQNARTSLRSPWRLQLGGLNHEWTRIGK